MLHAPVGQTRNPGISARQHQSVGDGCPARGTACRCPSLNASICFPLFAQQRTSTGAVQKSGIRHLLEPDFAALLWCECQLQKSPRDAPAGFAAAA